MSLNKLGDIAEDRGAGCASVHVGSQLSHRTTTRTINNRAWLPHLKQGHEQSQHLWDAHHTTLRASRVPQAGRQLGTEVLQDPAECPQQTLSGDLPMIMGSWEVGFERWQINATAFIVNRTGKRALLSALLNVTWYQLVAPLYYSLQNHFTEL